jgi:membrane protein DedA with SNARE-associated domain
VARLPTAAWLLIAAAGLPDRIAVPAVVAHHLGHESFDVAGLGVAAFASWFGLPGPGEPALIAAGVLASQHRLALLPVLLIAWLGATLGGIAGWLVGRKTGRALLTRRGPLLAIRVRAVARGEALFASHPVIAILLTPSWVAGIHRVRPALYQLVNVATAAVWAGAIGLGAYFAGPAVIDVVDDFGTLTTILLALVIVGAIAFELRRRRLRQPERRPG